ncbi:MAG: FHA domain-containing protein [Victivallaceae bacterium]|nr:FHA domain-containing protein [Victivallaceae bacterium]
MKIHFLNGSDAGQSLELDKESFKIGRELDNDIVLETSGLSRYHALLQCTAKGTWLISDLGSTNGSKVNGERIDRPHQLEEGDVISLGDQNIRFGEKNDLAENVAKIIFQKQQAGDEVPKVIFHTTTPTDTDEINISPLISIGDVDSNSHPKIIKTPEVPHPENKPDLSIFENKNINFFQKKNPQPQSAVSTPANSKKSLFSNLLFYTILVALVIIFAVIFIKITEDNEKIRSANDTAITTRKVPFVLEYTKELIDRNNIFRFVLNLDDEKAYFCIDDMKSQRHFTKEITEIPKHSLDNLRKEIEKTGFFNLEALYSDSSTGGASSERTLLVAGNQKLNRVTVRNTYAPNSFETIEVLVNEFAALYGLQTISMSPDEIIRQATEYYNKAEELYYNREANPENILKAIQRYRLAVEYLDQFQPKPKIWDLARKREHEAETLRKKLLDDLNFEIVRLANLNDYSEAKKALESYMLLVPEGSKAHNECIKKRLEFDREIRKRRR